MEMRWFFPRLPQQKGSGTDWQQIVTQEGESHAIQRLHIFPYSVNIMAHHRLDNNNRYISMVSHVIDSASLGQVPNY